MRLKRFLTAIAVCLFAGSEASACFMRSPQPVQVWLDHIHVNITDQVAVKTYHCTFKNPNGNAIVGGTCYMELEPARVDNMSVVVNGKEAKAEILDVEKANQVFTEIVKEGGSPALLEYYGNQLIQTKVPKVAAGATITVKLTYTTLLKKRGGLVRLQMLNTNPKALMQPLKSASVTVNIRSKTPIKNLYSPTHEIKIVETPEWDVSAKWEAKDYLPENPFVLYYQTTDEQLGASLLTHRELGEKGAFMLMLSPTVGKGAGQITESQILPKDIVFCVDTSGSMIENKKMDQAKEALNYCIKHLRPQDRFNIVDFGTSSRNLSADGLIPFNDTNGKRALNYVEKLSARGGTAIQEALTKSLEQLNDQAQDGRLKMIVFATDGLPTIGEREPKNILKKVDELNTKGVRVFVFGEGFNVNTSLLDFLALNHRGESEYILPKEDITEKISRFFDRVGSPIMTDLKLDFGGLNVSDVYPSSVKDVFRGEQVVIYGRYTGQGKKTIRLTGMANGEKKTYEYELEFPEISEDDRNAFVPRLWAGQKVDFLLNEIRKSETEDKELIEEVAFLAKRYGIVTPFTSFLVVDDNCNAPQKQQVANFTYRMRNEKGGLRNGAVGGYAVTNFSQQGVNRFDLGRQGATRNQLKQVEWAIQKEGVNKQQAIAAVRYVGNRCFYNANNRWYDSQFDNSKQQMLKNVEIGSTEYVKLINANPKLVKYMAQGESVVELKGQWYQFNARKGS